jgi:hypothetical protein
MAGWAKSFCFEGFRPFGDAQILPFQDIKPPNSCCSHVRHIKGTPSPEALKTFPLKVYKHSRDVGIVFDEGDVEKRQAPLRSMVTVGCCYPARSARKIFVWWGGGMQIFEGPNMPIKASPIHPDGWLRCF